MHRPTRRLRPALIAVLLALAPSWEPAESGGVPDKLPTDWVAVGPGPGAEIVQYIQSLPHDPNPLGVATAHLASKAYPQSFSAFRFSSLDGTPLAGRWIAYGDGEPRPGVVLVPGLTQTKDLKYVVELAELFAKNGWHVLAMDLRAHGESRGLSAALSTSGWKEADDILGAVRALRNGTAASSVSVIGFSMGGRSLVKAMARSDGAEIAAGIAVSAPLATSPPLTPPDPGYTPSPMTKFFLDFLGARSYYEYYERSARSYGVDLRTLEAEKRADRDIARVSAPLLLMFGLDDLLWHVELMQGLHDGGSFSLAYRDAVKDHPQIRTLLIRRGMHAGSLYLQDPHWFSLSVLSYLKHWQARDAEHVTVAVPPLDVLAEGTLSEQSATYRFVVRNHGPAVVGPLDVHLDVPEGARVGHCWLGAEGLGRCAKDGSRLTWTIPRLSGHKTTAGPFVAVLDVSTLKPGKLVATAWVDKPGILRQQVTLEKK